jgi:hypothetical protein
MAAKKARAVAPVQRASGGKAPQVVSGNKNVIDEAEEKTTGDNDTLGKKKGGRAKKQTGGKVVGLMTGGSVRPRLDRPGRKRGGGVGSNASPLSTAHNTVSVDAGSSNPKDTYGGTPK